MHFTTCASPHILEQSHGNPVDIRNLGVGGIINHIPWRDIVVISLLLKMTKHNDKILTIEPGYRKRQGILYSYKYNWRPIQNTGIELVSIS